MVPRSISRVTESAVKISMVMVRIVPTRPGTILSEVEAGRVVARMGAHLERRRGRRPGSRGRCAAPSARSWRARRAPSPPPPDRSRPPRPAAPGGRRAAARARNCAGISTANSTVAGGEQPVELGRVAHQVRDLEVARVLQRREDRAADVARLLQQHRGRQVARRRVDGVAEQDQLHQRDHDDHGERHAVAAELDELLDQHRARCGSAERRLMHGMRHPGNCRARGPSGR